jgi:hypothetical protein
LGPWLRRVHRGLRAGASPQNTSASKNPRIVTAAASNLIDQDAL